MAVGIVGQTASSPYYNPGTTFDTNTGAVIQAAPGALPIQNSQLPAPTNPTHASNPTQPNSSNYGGYGSKDAWFQALGLGQQAPVGWNGPSNQNSNIDNIYQPQIDQLNSQISNLQNVLFPSEEGQINSAATQAQNDVQSQLDSYNAQNQNDQNVLGQNSNSAYSQAQNTYNQLMQRNMAMYGQGSSAGPEINAILGQGFEQTLGNIGNAFQTNLGNLLTQASQAKIWATQQQADIKTQTQNQIAALTDQLNQSVMAINQDISQTEAQKSAAKLQIVQDAINQQQNLQNYMNQALVQLQAWETQQNYTVNQQASQLAAQHAQFLAQNPFANTSALGQYTTTPQNTQANASVTPAFSFSNNNNDPLQGLVS